MRFLLDESVDVRVAAYLRTLAHDVTVVAQDSPSSIPDTLVLAIARGEQRTLITNDRDFGELIFRQGQPPAGVIYLRLGTYELASIVARVSDVLEACSDQLNEFITVTPARIRVRRTPRP
jgi:predicted nuclease of predicted toxin-antitoxin system